MCVGRRIDADLQHGAVQLSADFADRASETGNEPVLEQIGLSAQDELAQALARQLRTTGGVPFARNRDRARCNAWVAMFADQADTHWFIGKPEAVKEIFRATATDLKRWQRRKRSVWHLKQQAIPLNHFATWGAIDEYEKSSSTVLP